MGACPPGSSGSTFINLQWDATFFAQLDSLECDESERQTLKQFEQDLQTAKNNFSAKAEEINQWKASVAALFTDSESAFK